MLHNVRQLHHRRWVIQISLLCDVRERDVMVNEKNERLPLFGRELQTRGDALGKKSARFRVRPGSDRLAGVVQQKRQIKDKRILQLLK